MVNLFGISEFEFSNKIDICSAPDLASLGPQKYILKIQLDILIHVRHLVVFLILGPCTMLFTTSQTVGADFCSSRLFAMKK